MTDQHRAIFFEVGLWGDHDPCGGGVELPGFEVQCREEHVQDAAGVFPEVDCISTFIGCKVGDPELERFPGLRLIATRSTGYDHIDLAACARRDVTVCNVPNYGENTVAEHTLGLMLALSRKMIRGYERTRRGEFSLEGLCGFDLHGKTLGVIGAGAIGLHVLRIGRALGMRCLAYDIQPHKLIAEVLDFEYTDLDTLLARSHVVSLHAPLLPATRHMIGAEALGKMRRGALLINTARGELVDTQALLEALDSGHLGGAGLDVFEGEGLVDEEALLLQTGASREQLQTVVRYQALQRRENVVVTPHMAFYSTEALQRILDVTVDNITAFFAGEPRNVVSA